MIPDSVKPYVYYEEPGIVLLHGDCLEILPLFEPDSVDLVLTDPPYGIDIVKNGRIGGTSKDVARWAGQINTEHIPVHGDDKPIDPTELLRVSKNQVIFRGNYIADQLPPSSCWYVWYKRIKNQRNNFADCELAWTSFDTPVRAFQHMWMGMLRDSQIQEHNHPTEKPIEVMKDCINLFTDESDVILDPFAGSFSTIVAAKQLGRKCIGIEIEQKYLDIAIERLRQEVLF